MKSTCNVVSEATSATSRRVVVFRKDILPISETFIPAQVEALTRWSPTLVGFQYVPGLNTDKTSPTVLYDVKHVIERIALKRDQFLPFADIPSRRVAALLAKQRPAIVHAHFGYDAVLIADAAQALNIPLVVTLHGTDVLRDWKAWASGKDGFFFRFYPSKIKKLFANPNVHFVAVSKALRDVAVQQGAPAERTRVIYTGIDTARFAQISSHPTLGATLLFVGRLVEFKGCEYLIRAVAQVQVQLPATRLIIAGDGPLRTDLEELSRTLGVKADFRGRVVPAEVSRLLAEATLFCLPSITDREGSFEAFGMVMLEAQAAGVPVITSAAAGPEAVVLGKTGFVYPERDTDALAYLLIDLLGGEKARLNAMSMAARSHVSEMFDLTVCTAKLEAYYDEIVQARPDWA